MGITDAGPDGNAALNGCDTYGLSVEMYDYIKSHRCFNGPYNATVMPQLFEGIASLTGCKKYKNAAKKGSDTDAEWKHEKDDLEQERRNVAALRGLGGPSQNNAAQKVQ